MRTPAFVTFACLLLGLVLACGDPGAGPVAIHFGRDACAHCGMVIDDPRHAAQIRTASRVERFDDAGCAMSWQIGHPNDVREFWVTDEHDGTWIDARSARFHLGRRTPMDFGFGAVRGDESGSIDFEAALQRAKERLDDRSRRRAH